MAIFFDWQRDTVDRIKKLSNLELLCDALDASALTEQAKDDTYNQANWTEKAYRTELLNRLSDWVKEE